MCVTMYILLMYDSLSIVLGNTEQPPRSIRVRGEHQRRGSAAAQQGASSVRTLATPENLNLHIGKTKKVTEN